MRRTTIIFAMIGVLLAIFAGPARAGLIAGDLNGLSDWQGTVHFEAAPSLYLYLDVDYCVYAPGQFGLSFGTSADPSGGSRYVYAYQIFNNLPGNPAPAGQQDYVSTFSVGLTGLDENDQAANVGTVAVTGGKNPTLKYFSPSLPAVPSTVTWKYTGTSALKYGSFSNILIYTSPFAPELDNATILGFYADAHLMPSPMPEPTTVAFLAVGLAAIVWRRRRRRGAQRSS
jgi:hypothetical protein